MTRPSRNGPPGPSRDGDWLSLTDLGRIYGISAVHTGKLLVAAGLRQANGEPSRKALMAGLARQQHPGHHHQALWNREGCGPHLERQGVEPQQQRNLVGLWADLLTALQQGSPSIAVSAEEMAGDLPKELVAPVNRELRQRGSTFQVGRSLRRAAAPRPACSPVPAADAGDPRRCG
ncbi:MAG: hypothetical protein ACKO22_09915 [Cyanobium sp.]